MMRWTKARRRREIFTWIATANSVLANAKSPREFICKMTQTDNPKTWKHSLQEGSKIFELITSTITRIRLTNGHNH
ncbi:hypothetical protein DFS33DRAFT_1360300, partial [Desarmillaria ectypa]